MKIKFMDTTLRDGEQTSGVSFADTEKLSIAKLLLEELKIDRVEIASAKVSQGEFNAVKRIIDWAAKTGYINQIEVLGFVDGKDSIDWIDNAGGKVMNLLSKGSLKHLEGQLRKTPAQHVKDIKKSIRYAESKNIAINLYLEDWSNGMKNSPDYVFYLLDSLKNEKIMRFMLPDTLGVLNPDETYDFCKQILDKYPTLQFDFHAHNDYDLAVANTMVAVKSGITGIHTTINGLGERTGNACISSVIACLKDHMNCSLSIDESKVTKVSKLVETFSGIRIPANKPIIGEYVFTQTCGVHADGDNKNNLYQNDLLPERFGRVRSYALGKTSGKANILNNLKELDIELDVESMKKVTARIIELGDKKENVTKEDLPYIISDVLQSETITNQIELVNYTFTVAKGLKPVASISLRIEDKMYEETSSGDGQYDAFSKALRSIYKRFNRKLPMLTDYVVTIPPGGRTDALVETVITWRTKDKKEREFKTRGLDSDQTVAAIKATTKMLNIIENF